MVEGRRVMDDLLFAFKRVHLAGNRNALKLLAAFGVTPARFDLMRVLYGNRTFSMQQSWLRAELGWIVSGVIIVERAIRIVSLQ